MMEKCCKKCQISKTIEEFPKNRNSCSVCWNKYKQEYRLKNRDKTNADKAAWKLLNSGNVKLHNKNHYRKNKEKCLTYSTAWRKANPDRRKEIANRWVKNHPDQANASVNRRRARLLNATVSWSEKFFIDEIYHLAKIRTSITGIKWHVDHIVPLRSNLVCGLHCEANLRVIPAVENMSKGNNHWPDMW